MRINLLKTLICTLILTVATIVSAEDQISAGVSPIYGGHVVSISTFIKKYPLILFKTLNCWSLSFFAFNPINIIKIGIKGKTQINIAKDVKSLKKIKINLFRSNFSEVCFLVNDQNSKIWGA